MLPEGINDVAGDLAQAAATAPRRAKAVVDDTKRKIRTTARDNVAVDTGELRDSIRETDDGVEATARHAPFVEHGTYKDPPQPFMDPAADEHTPGFVQGLEEVAGDV